MRSKDICDNSNLTAEEKWRLLVGTDAFGNLPQYKRLNHTGHCWMPCPYDLRVSDDKTRAMLGLSDTDPLPTKIDHTGANGRAYYMATASQGSWGYVCTFDNCPHKTSQGTAYFYR
jgi:hypothetical protein